MRFFEHFHIILSNCLISDEYDLCTNRIFLVYKKKLKYELNLKTSVLVKHNKKYPSMNFLLVLINCFKYLLKK